MSPVCPTEPGAAHHAGGVPRLLIRLTTVLLCACVVAVAAVPIFAAPSDNPLQRWLNGTDPHDCEIPCLFGVSPGRVTFENAVHLAERHPTLKEARLQRIDRAGNFGLSAAVFRAPAFRLAISEEYGGGVRYVLFDSPTIGRQARLADIIVALGSPAALQFSRNRFGYVLYYPLRGIEIRLILWRSDTVSPDDVVSGIYMQADRPPLHPDMQPWRGFVGLWRYGW